MKSIIFVRLSNIQWATLIISLTISFRYEAYLRYMLYLKHVLVYCCNSIYLVKHKWLKK